MKKYANGSMIRKPMNMGGMTQMSANPKNMPTPMTNKMNMGQGMMYGSSVKKKMMGGRKTTKMSSY